MVVTPDLCRLCGAGKVYGRHGGMPFCPKCDRRWHCGQPLLLGTEDLCPVCGRNVKL